MVIAIFPSLGGENLEDFSIRLAQQWRIGQKGLDNGVILLLFVAERRVRLEVGYGLEPVVPDAVAGRIIREVIAPRFREGRYAAGLEGAVAAVFERVAAREGAASRGRGGPPSSFPFWGLVGFFVILAVIAVMLLREAATSQRFIRRSGYTGGSGGWSAPVILPPIMWGGGGRRARDRDDDPFSGGGFSGGGGGFGGGGASGEW